MRLAPAAASTLVALAHAVATARPPGAAAAALVCMRAPAAAAITSSANCTASSTPGSALLRDQHQYRPVAQSPSASSNMPRRSNGQHQYLAAAQSAICGRRRLATRDGRAVALRSPRGQYRLADHAITWSAQHQREQQQAADLSPPTSIPRLAAWRPRGQPSAAGAGQPVVRLLRDGHRPAGRAIGDGRPVARSSARPRGCWPRSGLRAWYRGWRGLRLGAGPRPWHRRRRCRMPREPSRTPAHR